MLGINMLRVCVCVWGAVANLCVRRTVSETSDRVASELIGY